VRNLQAERLQMLRDVYLAHRWGFIVLPVALPMVYIMMYRKEVVHHEFENPQTDLPGSVSGFANQEKGKD
jgi:hypothetical protein